MKCNFKNLNNSYIIKAFEDLMKTPCEIYRKAEIQNEDGFMSFAEEKVCETVCHYHSLNKALMEYADKDSITSAYKFCLPIDTEIHINDIIAVGSLKFTVLHLSDASRKFETVCEATSYEQT